MAEDSHTEDITIIGDNPEGNRSKIPKPEEGPDRNRTDFEANGNSFTSAATEEVQITKHDNNRPGPEQGPMNLSGSAPLTVCTSYTDAEIDQLPPNAKKILERLQFRNPGKKQLEYKKFNPEKSERERKKLRRFQGTPKIRQGIFYSEDGKLVVDDRNICDCLDETCPGCFYPCPQCKSIKCGPVCRCNRKFVYDYVEDERRSYRLEFPDIPSTAS